MLSTLDDEQRYALQRTNLRTIVLCTGRRARLVRTEGATVRALPELRPRLLCASSATSLPRSLSRTDRRYGNSRRHLVGPVADRIAEWALRQADQVRQVSEVLEGLAHDAGYRGPIDRFVAFSDYHTFFEHPRRDPPSEPRVLFVGVLERPKAVDVLLGAWPEVLDQVPAAQLTIVGDGGQREELHARVRLERLERLEPSVRFLAPMTRSDRRELVDSSSCLVLQSRSEGLARIVLEAMARARPIVATRVGGIEELVEDGRNGRLVPAENAHELAHTLVDVLDDTARARLMDDESRRRALARNPLAEYEAGMERLADWISRR